MLIPDWNIWASPEYFADSGCTEPVVDASQSQLQLVIDSGGRSLLLCDAIGPSMEEVEKVWAVTSSPAQTMNVWSRDMAGACSSAGSRSVLAVQDVTSLADQYLTQVTVGAP